MKCLFLDYSDLFSIASHGDDIQDFETRWDEFFLVSVSEVPIDKDSVQREMHAASAKISVCVDK